ncbi:MAG: hypothetical protein AABX32_04770 [Nanoarchaeota archaeon]
MFIPKKYGESRIEKCPFCEKQATTINKQGIAVCVTHREDTLDDLKCVCGETLDVLKGKFGAFFKCIDCGNMGLKKVLEFNTVKAKNRNFKEKSSDDYSDNETQKINNSNKNPGKTKTEITIRSDDPRYFD